MQINTYRSRWRWGRRRLARTGTSLSSVCCLPFYIFIFKLSIFHSLKIWLCVPLQAVELKRLPDFLLPIYEIHSLAYYSDVSILLYLGMICLTDMSCICVPKSLSVQNISLPLPQMFVYFII